ncbi:MAG: hypothetical protein WDW38_005830 [Sanguina aurantia]
MHVHIASLRTPAAEARAILGKPSTTLPAIPPSSRRPPVIKEATRPPATTTAAALHLPCLACPGCGT